MFRKRKRDEAGERHHGHERDKRRDSIIGSDLGGDEHVEIEPKPPTLARSSAAIASAERGSSSFDNRNCLPSDANASVQSAHPSRIRKPIAGSSPSRAAVFSFSRGKLGSLKRRLTSPKFEFGAGSSRCRIFKP